LPELIKKTYPVGYVFLLCTYLMYNKILFQGGFVNRFFMI
jgi:hypothetical protein